MFVFLCLFEQPRPVFIAHYVAYTVTRVVFLTAYFYCMFCISRSSRLAIASGRSFNERAWKLRALRYALLPSSSWMLLELMEMLFPLISYIIVLQKRFNEILKYK